MKFFKKLLNTNDEPINSYQDFWNWFKEHEKQFINVVKSNNDIEQNFFDVMKPKLNQLREGFWYLTGETDDGKVELIITVDSEIKNIVFAEELIDCAPEIPGWKFTALKPKSNINDINIKMNEYQFGSENVAFYSNEDPEYPDEVNLTFVYQDQSEIDDMIKNGVYILLDNILGEEKFATSIDEMEIIGTKDIKKDLVPLEKLDSFLEWREKEFIENYSGVRYNTENDNYTSFEATTKDGATIIAIINSDLLLWNRKASHPWILSIEINYKSNENGMPHQEEYDLLENFENQISMQLKDSDGYLNVGRETGNSKREIYFACKEYRTPSKVVAEICNNSKNFMSIEYHIYKDKYWHTFKKYEKALL